MAMMRKRISRKSLKFWYFSFRLSKFSSSVQAAVDWPRASSGSSVLLSFALLSPGNTRLTQEEVSSNLRLEMKGSPLSFYFLKISTNTCITVFMLFSELSMYLSSRSNRSFKNMMVKYMLQGVGPLYCCRFPCGGGPPIPTPPRCCWFKVQ